MVQEEKKEVLDVKRKNGKLAHRYDSATTRRNRYSTAEIQVKKVKKLKESDKVGVRNNHDFFIKIKSQLFFLLSIYLISYLFICIS